MQASCDFGRCGLDLYAWPVRSITSISYVDTGGNSQTLDPSSYVASLIQRPVRIVAAYGSVLPALALRPAAVTITCEAGYATPALVPQRVKRAMLMTVNHFYENRSSVLTGQRAAAIEVPQGAKDLLAGLRTWTVLMALISSGDLDRTITFQRKLPRQGRGQAGQEQWDDVATVAAQVQDVLPSRAERFAEGLSIQSRPARVRCRYRSDVTGDMRILYGSRVMQITDGPAEIGRREGLEMMAADFSTAGGSA